MSKQQTVNYPVIQRKFALRFDLDTHIDDVATMIDLVNYAIAALPGSGYICPQPEIVMEGMTCIEAYYLYADTRCWDAFLDRKFSFMPRVEKQSNLGSRLFRAAG